MFMLWRRLTKSYHGAAGARRHHAPDGGVGAGERDPDGNFPDGSINQRVEHRLAELAQLQQKFAEGTKAKDE